MVGGKTSGVLPRGMRLGASVVTGDGPELTTEVDYAMAMVIESAGAWLNGHLEPMWLIVDGFCESKRMLQGKWRSTK